MLKPCPFCGSKIIYQWYYDDKYGYKTPIVFCDICKATLEVEDDSPYIDVDEDYEYRKKAVIRVWNSRVGE